METLATLGPYALGERIAASGIADSFAACWVGGEHTNLVFALKFLRPEVARNEGFMDVLVEQLRLAVRLNHVNVAQTFDFARWHDRAYIMLEYVAGTSLENLLVAARHSGSTVPAEVSVFVVSESAAGLSYAHSRRDERGRALNIVHGDVRPRNILLSFGGEVKVVDFGLALSRRMTDINDVAYEAGRQAHVAPEVARGNPPDARSDLFSLGAMAWELLTGKSVWPGTNNDEMLASAVEGRIRLDVPPIGGANEELLDIVRKALSVDPATRYPGTAEFRTALAGWLRKTSPGFGRHRLKAFVTGLVPERPDGPLAGGQSQPLHRKDFVPHDPASVLNEGISAPEWAGPAGNELVAVIEKRPDVASNRPPKPPPVRSVPAAPVEPTDDHLPPPPAPDTEARPEPPPERRERDSSLRNSTDVPVVFAGKSLEAPADALAAGTSDPSEETADDRADDEGYLPESDSQPAAALPEPRSPDARENDSEHPAVAASETPPPPSRPVAAAAPEPAAASKPTDPERKPQRLGRPVAPAADADFANAVYDDRISPDFAREVTAEHRAVHGEPSPAKFAARWLLGFLLLAAVCAVAVWAILRARTPVPIEVADAASAFVSSRPQGARILVNGIEIGPSTPGPVTLDPGRSVEISVTLDGFASPAPQTVSGSPGQQEITFELEPLSHTVHVATEPAGAAIFLDGERVGVTPGDVAITRDYRSGADLLLRLDGFLDEQVPVSWAAGVAESTVARTLSADPNWDPDAGDAGGDAR